MLEYKSKYSKYYTLGQSHSRLFQNQFLDQFLGSVPWISSLDQFEQTDKGIEYRCLHPYQLFQKYQYDGSH